MHKTKMTKKGQITIPAEHRKKLGLEPGAVITIELEKDNLVIKKPEEERESLFGAWKELTDEDVKRMKTAWRELHEKTPI